MKQYKLLPLKFFIVNSFLFSISVLLKALSIPLMINISYETAIGIIGGTEGPTSVVIKGSINILPVIFAIIEIVLLIWLLATRSKK